MLEDRDYMRQPAYNEPSFSHWLRWPNWSWTLVVLLVNIACFLVECAVSHHPLSFAPNNPFCEHYLALSLYGMKHGFVWQLLTYQFMHAGILHLAFNCWAIYVFGRILEELLGARNFILILLSSGVVGGLFQVLAAVLVPDMYDAPVVGASAGAFGLVAAFATLMPERELFMLLYFIIPVRMRAKTLLIVSAALACAGLLAPAVFDKLMGGNIANAAHLGGMVAGIIYIRKVIQGRWFHGQGVGIVPDPHPPVMPTASAPTFWRAKPVRSEMELSPDELLRTQVDPILDKISAHGLQSLTPREREILEKASGKLAKR
jgi:membrane associated rhomboid family serine protease